MTFAKDICPRREAFADERPIAQPVIQRWMLRISECGNFVQGTEMLRSANKPVRLRSVVGFPSAQSALPDRFTPHERAEFPTGFDRVVEHGKESLMGLGIKE